jgi:hypothetical protein
MRHFRHFWIPCRNDILVVDPGHELRSGAPRDLQRTNRPMTPREDLPFTVTALEFRSRNDSLPPPDRHQEWVRYPLGSGDDELRELLERTLRQTRVNGQVTLGEYIAMHVAGDEEAIARVRAFDPEDPFPTGGDSTSLTFTLLEGPAFVLRNLREHYSGDLVEALILAVKSAGKSHEGS